jgi:hypothetical protein
MAYEGTDWMNNNQGWWEEVHPLVAMKCPGRFTTWIKGILHGR